MERDDLIRVHGPPETPPETQTLLATDDEGNLYRVKYELSEIEPTADDLATDVQTEQTR